jgi:hypothetical protein
MKFRNFFLKYKVEKHDQEKEKPRNRDEMETSFLEMKDRGFLTTEEVEIALKPYRERHREKNIGKKER